MLVALYGKRQVSADTLAVITAWTLAVTIVTTFTVASIVFSF